MKMQLKTKVLGVVMLSAISAGGVGASEPADSSSMLCSITHTVSCDALRDCVDGPADAINLPVFINFNPEKKTFTSAREGGAIRTSKIASVVTAGNTMVLRGDEGENVWIAKVNKTTGGLTGTIAADGVGYILFGSCLAR